MKPLDLAYAIVNYAIDCGFPVSNLRLQKLMYFCQLENYREKAAPLIEPGSFEAWSFGPVVRDVYIHYCLWGGLGIDKKENATISLESLNKNLQIVIDKRLAVAPWDLVEESHIEGGAWRKVYRQNEKIFIPEEYIRQEATWHNVK